MRESGGGGEVREAGGGGGGGAGSLLSARVTVCSSDFPPVVTREGLVTL